ncbi:hypothetical protein GGR51DRAFT_572092 [Nemania sp. FL0031]|nr:hypothetical protein GGR51DRAFT_572092 [Nemania sp. FL0031]
MLSVLGHGIASLSRLRRWELIVGVVGNLTILMGYILTATRLARPSIEDYDAAQANIDSRQQGDAAVDSETPTLQGDEPPPPYSKDPEAGVTIDPECPAYSKVVKDKTKNCQIYHRAKIFGIKVFGATGQLLVVFLRWLLFNKNPPPRQAETETETESPIAMDIVYCFGIPGVALVLAGVVGQLKYSLLVGWSQIDGIYPIIIVLSPFPPFIFLLTFIYTVCFPMEDCFREGSIAFTFLLVLFDKFFIAALVDDMVGTKHILDDGGLTLSYIILSKLPALAL